MPKVSKMPFLSLLGLYALSSHGVFIISEKKEKYKYKYYLWLFFTFSASKNRYRPGRLLLWVVAQSYGGACPQACPESCVVVQGWCSLISVKKSQKCVENGVSEYVAGKRDDAGDYCFCVWQKKANPYIAFSCHPQKQPPPMLFIFSENNPANPYIAWLFSSKNPGDYCF